MKQTQNEQETVAPSGNEVRSCFLQRSDFDPLLRGKRRSQLCRPDTFDDRDYP
jgi:hypothetical protein